MSEEAKPMPAEVVLLPMPAEAVLFESYTLAIVRLKSAILKAQATNDNEMILSCDKEIQLLEMRRGELLEQLENRIGGS
jgi:hypothetical protein